MTPRQLDAIERRIMAEREELLDAAARRLDGQGPRPGCAVEGCPGRSESRGLCAAHYARQHARPGRSHRATVAP